MRPACRLLLPIATLVVCFAGSAPVEGAAGRPCDVDVTPAATLLIPYFELAAHDLVPPVSAPDATTVFTVYNQGVVGRVAHVTLWTDWAIPTASFDLHLLGSDEQSVNIYDIFRGVIEQTPTPSSCGALRTGVLRLNPALHPTGNAATDLEILRKAHTGEPTPGTPSLVASAPHPEKIVGYITVDVVKQCTALFPSSDGYFRDGGTGIALNDNVLSGDVLSIDFAGGYSRGEPAVHLRASRLFSGRPYTFYARYVRGRGADNRQPVGYTWSSRFVIEGSLNEPSTDLVVWRDTRSSAVAPLAAGARPAWYPLTLAPYSSCDEDRRCTTLATGSLPLATQRVSVGSSALPVRPGAAAGILRLDLAHTRVTTGTVPGGQQAWVVTEYGATFAGGYAATAVTAVRVKTSCQP